MSHKPRLLIVDDEPFNVEILLEYLEDGGYELDTAEDGQEAWEKLEAAPDHYDVVILDRMMPRMNGMEVLSRIKAHPVMQCIPVILQTALAAHDEILEGIQAGAWYYLTKPFDEELLRSVLATAIEDRMRYRRMQEESSMASRIFGLLHEARFRFRTLESAYDLATMLANACPEPSKVAIGLSELLINAVEHGNLGITYDEKSALHEAGRWEEEVNTRLQDPVLGAREAEVRYVRGDTSIEITITDEGEGFDWQAYLEIDPARAFDTHGRGIAMSRMIAFDRLEYRGCGNEVVATIELAED